MKRKSLTRIWAMLLIGVITLSLAAPAAQAAAKEEDAIYWKRRRICWSWRINAAWIPDPRGKPYI